MQSLFKPTVYDTDATTDPWHTKFHLGTILDFLTTPFMTLAVTIPICIHSFLNLLYFVMFTETSFILKGLFTVNMLLIAVVLSFSILHVLHAFRSQKARLMPWDKEIVLITGGKIFDDFVEVKVQMELAGHLHRDYRQRAVKLQLLMLSLQVIRRHRLLQRFISINVIFQKRSW